MIMQVAEVACGIGASRTRRPFPSVCRSKVLIASDASCGDRGQLLAPVGRQRHRFTALVVVGDLDSLGLGDELSVDPQVVIQVEAFGTEPAGSYGNLDLLPQAHRGFEVDLDASDD